VISDIIEIIT